MQGYIKMAAEGRYLDALKLIKQDNPFPAVCGSICNRRCEAACTRGTVDDPVAIDEIKRFIAEQELHADKRYIPAKRTHRENTAGYDEKIAVIGAGPAGLSCAYYLASLHPSAFRARSSRAYSAVWSSCARSILTSIPPLAGAVPS